MSTKQSKEKAGDSLRGAASSRDDLFRGQFNNNTKAAARSMHGIPAVREDAGIPCVSVGQEEEKEKSVSDVVGGYANAHDGWESLQVKKLVRGEFEKWIYGLADWQSFITLTFRDEKSPDVASSLFKWFVRKTNEHAFGKHYTQKVGHSYYSYVVGMEKQSRDVIHFHVLVDKPLDFAFIHKFWGKRCGFAWIDGSIKSKVKAVNYVCKYCVKGGEIDTYKVKKDYLPEGNPAWWKNSGDISSRVGQDALPWTTCEALDDRCKR